MSQPSATALAPDSAAAPAPASPMIVSGSPRARAVALLLLLLPAAVAPFVPFVYTDSPLSVVQEVCRGVWAGHASNGDLHLLLIAAPFFLGLPIVLWQFRRLVGARVTRFGRISVFALAGGSAMLTLWISILLLVETVRRGSFRHDETLPGLLALAVLLIGVPLLWWLKRKAAAESLPPAALALAYLANAVLCLVAFSRDGTEIGWKLTLAVSFVLAAQLAVFLHHAFAARRAAHATQS
jgi:hypothetical protein